MQRTIGLRAMYATALPALSATHASRLHLPKRPALLPARSRGSATVTHTRPHTRLQNALVDFIKVTPQWREALQADPFNLRIREDPEFPDLALFSYNQIASDFHNPVVRASRGIILQFHEGQGTPAPVCWPFNKFGNYGEGFADKIDWATARVQEKLDGSIMKLWYYNTGNSETSKWMWSTNNIIDAMKAQLGNSIPYKTFGELTWKVWNAVPESKALLNTLRMDCTYIFELTSPHNQNIVPHSKAALTLLGIRDNITGDEMEPDLGAAFPRPKLYTFKTFDEMLEASKILPYSDEGYVVVDAKWNRVKVKGLAYLSLHRLMGEPLSMKRAFDVVRTGETSELLSYFPEFKDMLDQAAGVADRVSKYLVDQEDNMSRLGVDGSDRKKFALFIKDFPFKSYFFCRLDGKMGGPGEFVAKLEWDAIPAAFKKEVKN